MPPSSRGRLTMHCGSRGARIYRQTRRGELCSPAGVHRTPLQANQKLSLVGRCTALFIRLPCVKLLRVEFCKAKHRRAVRCASARLRGCLALIVCRFFLWLKQPQRKTTTLRSVARTCVRAQKETAKDGEFRPLRRSRRAMRPPPHHLLKKVDENF